MPKPLTHNGTPIRRTIVAPATGRSGGRTEKRQYWYKGKPIWLTDEEAGRK